MSAAREKLLAAYARLGNLRAACAETGAAPYVAYIWCRKAGVLKADDKSRYGSQAQRRGASAEAEFKRLVPAAMPANSALVKNCPGFDFDVDGILVDVKYSSRNKCGGAWRFFTARHKPLAPDLYVVFFATDPGGDLADGYRLLLIPHDFVSDRSVINLQPNSGSELWQLEVQPETLSGLLATTEAAR